MRLGGADRRRLGLPCSPLEAAAVRRASSSIPARAGSSSVAALAEPAVVSSRSGPTAARWWSRWKRESWWRGRADACAGGDGAGGGGSAYLTGGLGGVPNPDNGLTDRRRPRTEHRRGQRWSAFVDVDGRRRRGRWRRRRRVCCVRWQAAVTSARKPRRPASLGVANRRRSRASMSTRIHCYREPLRASNCSAVDPDARPSLRTSRERYRNTIAVAAVALTL